MSLIIDLKLLFAASTKMAAKWSD